MFSNICQYFCNNQNKSFDIIESFDIFLKSMYNKKGNGETTNVVCRIRYEKQHIKTRQSFHRCVCFFYWFSLLLKIIATAIIKVIAMIVIPTSPTNNM